MNETNAHPPALTNRDRDEIFGLGFDGDDPKNVRWAFVIAVTLHAVLFSLHLPEMSVRAEAPERERLVFEVERFRPPPPERQELMPQELPRDRGSHCDA